MKTIGIALFFLICSHWGLAQPLIDDTRKIPVLVFENIEKSDTRFIREGGVLKYKLRGDKRKVFSGKLEAISEKSMTINGKEVQFENCSMIAGRVRTDKEMIGGIVAGMGFTAMGIGAGIAGVTANAGIASISTGAVFFSTGMAMMFTQKRFRMDKGWSVHGGVIQYNLSE